ncbi:hypothetical protein EON65_01665 [archaeon]|nr:MAG: hypothetical protein EON65_01665 [archaeon]
MESPVVRKSRVIGAVPDENIFSQIVSSLDEVQQKYESFVQETNVYLSPMAVSQILVVLKKVRSALELFYSMSPDAQEQKAYLCLNAVKLILHYSQPLLWFSCGKYILETVTYAILCMEGVINLCTVRHMKFRLKLYSSAIYAALSQQRIDEATNLFLRLQKEYNDLREREFLDPPVPADTVKTLDEVMKDIQVLKFVIDFFRDPDSLGFTVAKTSTYYALSAEVSGLPFLDCVLCEYIRVHLLLSGNKNETYMKRSRCLVKAIESYVVSSNKTDLALESALEVMYVLLFDNFLTAEDVDKVSAYIQTAFPDPASLAVEHADKLDILVQVFQALKAELDVQNETHYKIVLRLFQQLGQVMYSQFSHRTRSVFSYVVIELFKRVFYRPIQVMLSAEQGADKKQLKDLTVMLMTCVHALDNVLSNDSLFYVNISIVLGNALFALGEYRQCVGVLKHAIDMSNDIRNYRVDVLIHLPEDVRDIISLQHASLTATTTLYDWYDSHKRLGAYAYAGYGLFGLNHSAEVVDQALQEAQIDIYSLYFRAELMYYKESVENKQRMKQGVQGEVTYKSLDDWSIVHVLQGMCNKNRYITALLHLEMAKMDYSLHPDSNSSSKYLTKALTCIKDVIAQEHILCNNFRSILVKTNQGFDMPVLLVRNSKYIYLVPTQCNAIKNAKYYKIFGKEKGSGTNVSIYNNLLPGCECRINSVDLSHLYNTASQSSLDSQTNNINKYLYDNIVKMGPLQSNEEYLFASAAFNQKDAIIGNLSPSTPVIETVNVLNTNVLYSLLLQTSVQINHKHNLQDLFIQYISPSYLLHTPLNLNYSLTSGHNLFIAHSGSHHANTHVDHHKLHLSSANEVSYFIQAYYYFVESTFVPNRNGSSVTFNALISNEQMYINILSHLSNLLGLCSQYRQSQYLYRTVVLLYNVVQDMGRFNFLHFGRYMHSTLVSGIITLQSDMYNVMNWNEDVHRIYLSLLTYLALVAAHYNMVSSFSVLSEQVYKDDYVVLSDENYHTLLLLYRVVEEKFPAASMEKFVKNIKSVLSNNALNKINTVDYWSNNSLYRRATLLLCEEDVSNNQSIVESMYSYYTTPDLETRPYSSYLQLLAHIATVCQTKLPGNKDAIKATLKKFPIVADFLHSSVKTVLTKAGLNVTVTLVEFNALRAGANAVGAGAKDGKKDGKKDAKKGAEPVEIASDVVIDGDIVGPEEVALQFMYMGQMLQLLSPSLPTTNTFVCSLYGLGADIPANIHACIKEEKDRVVSALPAETAVVDAAIEHLSYYAGSFLCYMQRPEKSMHNAMNMLLAVFNYLQSQYIDISFVLAHCSRLKDLLYDVFVKLLEWVLCCVSCFGTNSISEVPEVQETVEIVTSNIKLQSVNADMTPYVRRETQEKLKGIIDILVYLLQLVYSYNVHEYNVYVVPRLLQVLTVYHTYAADCVKMLSDRIMPYVQDMQQLIVEEYTNVHNKSVTALNDFVNAYNAMQASKRKKKLKINRLEKDEEEILFENERDGLQKTIDSNEAQLKVRQQEMEHVLAIFQQIGQESSKFYNQLLKCRQHLNETYQAINNVFAGEPQVNYKVYDYSVIFTDNSLSQCIPMVEKIKKEYDRLVYVLRENKERMLLLQALYDISNLMVKCKLFNEVFVYCNDSVDGYFSVYNAVDSYKEIMHNIKGLKEDKGGVFYLLLSLHKLVKYCYRTSAHGIDYKKINQYVLFAAELCKFLFEDSIMYPQSSIGFAAYECDVLYNLGLLSYYDVSFACIHTALYDMVCTLLYYNKQYMQALPLIVLCEHVSTSYMHSVQAFLSARLLRVYALIRLNLYAEAISMLSQTPQTLLDVAAHRYSDKLRYKRSLVLAENGLYFDQCPSFHNCFLTAPPNAANTNEQALDYVNGFAAMFEQFLDKNKQLLSMRIPEDQLNKEQRDMVDANVKAAQEASAKGGKKAGKGAAEAPPVDATQYLPTMNMIDYRSVCYIHFLCALLLNSVFSADSSGANAMPKLMSNASGLIVKLKEKLLRITMQDLIDPQDYAYSLLFHNYSKVTVTEGQKWSNQFVRLLVDRPDFLQLYELILHLEVENCIAKREYRPALAILINNIYLLRHPLMSQNLTYYKHLTLTVNYYQMQLHVCNILYFQNKLLDCISVCQNNLKECALVKDDVLALHFYYILALVFAQRGESIFSLENINNVIVLAQSNYLVLPLLLQAKMHKARLLIRSCQFSSSSNAKSSASELIRNWFLAKVELKDSLYLSEQWAAQFNIPRPDSNLLYMNSKTAPDVQHRKNQTVMPSLFNFTELHTNDPNPYRLEHNYLHDPKDAGKLFSTPAPAKDEKNSRKGGKKSQAGQQERGTEEGKRDRVEDANILDRDIIWCEYESAGLRLGPVDLDQNYVLTRHTFVNVYQSFSRVYLSCHLALLSLLCEMYKNRLFVHMQNCQEDLSTLYQELAHVHNNNHNKYNHTIFNNIYTTHQYKGYGRYVDNIFTIMDERTEVVEISEEKMIKDMLIVAEQTLKVNL